MEPADGNLGPLVMAREWFDFDPVTGITEYVEFTSDGKLHYTQEQDVEPYLDWAKFLANTGGTEHNFRGENWMYAVIPPLIQGELFKKGVNILNPADNKRLLWEINTNYPDFKTTHRHHEIK